LDLALSLSPVASWMGCAKWPMQKLLQACRPSRPEKQAD
jgi:hypothetical protein